MLVLASNSPRRRQLLSAAGLDFVVQPASLDESHRAGELPEDYVLRLAASKCRAAWEEQGSALPGAEAWIGADTAVVIDGNILGKPDSPAAARSMLKLLCGRSHQVHTALAVFSPKNLQWIESVCISTVSMRSYSQPEIDSYIATGDPLDKAGGYAIQHQGFQPVDHVDGCYANVIGLPVCRLGQMLASLAPPMENSILQACRPTAGTPCLLYHKVLLGDEHPADPTMQQL